MWTNNYKLVLAQAYKGSSTVSSENSTYTNTLGEKINISSAVQLLVKNVATSVSYYGSYDITGVITSTQSNYYGYYQIFVGTGDTEPTKEDYTLANPVALSWNKAPTMTIVPNIGECIIEYTLTNNTDSQQIIKEIGLCARVQVSNSIVTNCLLNRRLLASPVTMEVGDIYTFSFRIDTSNVSE